MQTLNVALGERAYPIHIGSGLLGAIDTLLSALAARHIVVVTNPVVADHHLLPLRSALARAAKRVDVITIPDGEAHKDWQTLYSIHTRLLELGAERSSLIVALGGGVVGDIAGLAAATYQRGIRVVQVPTTLLAQVDSSVGGKTAVNHPLGKNMIGVFYQPSAVIIDVDTLSTLPDRQFAAGMAEVIKYGAACDAVFFTWLEQHCDRILARDREALAHAIAESCRNKAAVVVGDERESGNRALLNFGHTFGHAIEAATGYDGSWLHGEAVAAGMVMASSLSTRICGLSEGDSARVMSLLQHAHLPVRAPAFDIDRYMELMRRDKKVLGGTLRFVLLDALGRAALRSDVPVADVEAVLAAHGA
jgi:3-dehydroquinate synthase